MEPPIQPRDTRSRLFLALIAALALVLAACRSDRPPTAGVVEPLAAPAAPVEQGTDERDTAPPDAPAREAPPEPPAAPAAAVPAVPTGVTPAEAAHLVGQAYRELTVRLFREVRPADLLDAGWRGVRDEARRQGMVLVGEALQPHSEAGGSDIDAFTRKLALFLGGPGAGLDAARLAQAAIRGMTAAVGDSHTRYVSPQQSQFRQDPDGSYSGIGVVTRQDDFGLTIGQVYAGSPAEQAGLRPGDRIVGVNGADIRGRQQADVSSQIRGEPGTPVHLTLVSPNGERREVTINRARIAVPVVSARMLEDGIGYLAVTALPRRSAIVDAAADFETALTRLQGEGARAFVLDLRGNPGGDPTTSVDIASNFTQDGPIFISVNRNGPRTVYSPNRSRKLVAAPVAVLIDGGSASGAEVVASAIAEYGAGYLIGTRTCGCLSVGQALRLDDKSEIVVTVQQALTGRYERSLEGHGLDPDEVVRAPRPQGPDAALERAVEYLQGRLR